MTVCRIGIGYMCPDACKQMFVRAISNRTQSYYNSLNMHSLQCMGRHYIIMLTFGCSIGDRVKNTNIHYNTNSVVSQNITFLAIETLTLRGLIQLFHDNVAFQEGIVTDLFFYK